MPMRSGRMESRWVNVDGMRIHMRAGGMADARVDVVLIHGLGVSGAYWLPTAVLLSEHFRVLVPDLPGFGESEKPSRVLNLRELADVLVAWMDVLGIERTVLVGNSMGCQVAVKAALAHPGRVSRLILQGPTIDPSARSAFQQTSRLLIDGLVEPPALLPVVMRDYLKCGYRRISQTLQHSLADPIEKQLPHIDVPALVVRGERDPIVPQRWTEEAARLLPFGSHVVVPGAAHAANFSHPEEFARIIRQALATEHGGLRS